MDLDLVRVARTAGVTLEHTFHVGEVPTDSSVTVTVSIVDANGAAVTSGNATSAGVGTGKYTFALPGQAQLRLLTVTWTATIAGSVTVETDYVEIVGGFLFGLAEGRASDSSLADTVQYPASQLVSVRTEVEVECETICDRAFVPRYGRAVLDGTGTSELVLGVHDVRTIRAVKVSPRVGQTFTALTAAELAALAVTDDSVIIRTDRAVWPEGRDNVIVEFEHGLDAPPRDLKRAAMVRLRSRLNISRTGIPDRAVSFTVSDGGTFRLDMPDAYKVGIPDVDAVYGRYSKRSGAGTGVDGRQVPASRQLNFDPQHSSLFHGGIR